MLSLADYGKAVNLFRLPRGEDGPNWCTRFDASSNESGLLARLGDRRSDENTVFCGTVGRYPIAMLSKVISFFPHLH